MDQLQRHAPASGTVLAPDDDTGDGPGIDIGALTGWVQRHKVLVGGLALVIVQMAWKIQFITHLYFRHDDFIDLDIAIRAPFTWKYLTFNGVGHLIIGIRALAWVLARISLYNWPLDSGLNVFLVLLAGLAALRLLRSLFNDRPVILIPLAIYLICPLTLPALGEWSSGIESVPLQLAMLMALDAHVRYLRSGARRYFVYAVLWVLFGLAFFEKALILPPLLFALTSAYFAGPGPWLDRIRATAVRYWRGWATYLAVMVCYGAILFESLKTSRVQPAAPSSTAAAAKVAWGLIGRTFLTSAFGGPWRWFSGGSYGLVAPPSAMVLLSMIAAVAVVGMSIWIRPIAWRAWCILAGWLIVADVLPIIVGRVNNYPLALLATETRYVADATPLLAVCLGLAFIPLASAGPAVAAPRGGRLSSQPRQLAAGALVGIFAFGSLWSVQSYEQAANGRLASGYISHAAAALRLAPAGTRVADAPVPPKLVLDHNGSYIEASQLIGDMQLYAKVRKLAWIERPDGTIDGLRIFGPDGRLYLAKVIGAVSAQPPASNTWHGCWPEHKGRIAVRFDRLPPTYTAILRIGYIWGSSDAAMLSVRYGSTDQGLEVRHGLHAAYLPISGSFRRIVIANLGGVKLCVGDVEAGLLAPNTTAPAIPPR